MPKGQSKKTTHKKTAHEHTKKHVPKSVQQDITNAVNALPELLIERATWNTLSTQHTDTNESDAEPPQKSMIPQPKTSYQPPQHSGTLLVIGVALLMSTILGLWAWNMKSMVNNVFAAPSEEKQILANVGDDFGDILNHIQAQDSISAKLDELQAAVASSTSSTPTTTATNVELKAALGNILHPTTSTP